MSLVAWYPLIDGSLENKGLDTTPLTLHGTVPFTNGRVRTAPTFSANESNYYTMPPITKVNDFSICCWVKCSSTANGWIVFQGVTSNNNRFGFVDVAGTSYIGFRIGSFFQNFTIEKGKWYHLCMTTNDTNTVVCYINGNAVGTGLYEGYSFTENETLYFSRGKDPSELLNGQLQDFRYYDHCLSPKEVKEIAKGLCLHLPLKGTNARPNLFKNSATMFNTVGNIPGSTTCTSSLTLVFDENAPCGANGKILRATVNRPDNTVDTAGGYYYTTNITGIPTLTIGQKYCVSIWARCTANNVSFVLERFMEGHTLVKGSANRTLTSEWKRYYAIFTATKETSTTCFYIGAPIGASGTLEYCCPKLELLSPTPYIPNVDDTQYSDYVLDYEPDCSGNAFDATKYGDLTTSDSNGRYNTAVAFNGTNTYLQGLAPTNSECKEFTIATWVKLNNVSTSHALYACRTVAGEGFALFYVGAGGIRLDDGVSLDDGVRNAIFSNSTLDPNKWYHIAVTRDAAERKLYINGEFVSSGTTTGALANMANMYQVGESNAQTTNPIDNVLNGSLSDFRLYTSVLSADDVKELYETSVSIAHNPPSLTESAYYNYVEGQKHSTFDKSKFTVVGSPTITDDGVASGFSIYSDKIYNKSLTNISASQLSTDGNWSFKCRFTLPLNSPNRTEIPVRCPYGAYGFIVVSVGLPAIYVQPFNTVIRAIKGSDFAWGSTYDIEVIFNGINSKVKVKKDGIALPDTSFTPPTSPVALGGTSFAFGSYNADSEGYKSFSGSIDLKHFSITVDGKEVFSGNKTGLDVIKPDNYTVVGSPTISEDGVASGFSSSNYLTKDLSFLNGKNDIEIYTPIIHVESSTTSTEGAFGITRAVGLTSIENWIINGEVFFAIYNNNVMVTRTSIPNCVGHSIQFKATIKDNVYTQYYSLDGGDFILTPATVAPNPATNSETRVFNSSYPFTFGKTNVAGSAFTTGSIDLNAFKIYVDGNLVYQPCLKIPYTESKTGIKIVDSVYLDRVKDVYDQHYLERYYTVDETTQTVYEYPLFRDSMHSYEFDEGFDQSIKKVGVMISPEFTETTDVNMVKGNTKTTKLIEV